MRLLNELNRYFLLSGFWRQRTSLYNDMATALSERELPKDFIEGELQIATAVKTADKNRARGLMYIRSLMDDGDPSLHEVLVAAMPHVDSLALATLKDTKDRVASLKALANTVEQQIELTKMVRQALISPMILIPVGFAFSYVLSTVSIPEFAKAAPPEIWTGMVLFVRVFAETFSMYGPAVFGIFISAFVWLFAWGLPNLTVAWRYRAESARSWSRVMWILICPVQPILEMYRNIQGTRMLGNLANLLQSRLLLADALQILAEGAQPWMKRHLLRVLMHLQQSPGDYVGAFSYGILSPYLLGRLNSMVRRDAGGEFSRVLIELGSTGLESAREAVKKSVVKLNAILLVLTLSVIVFLYLGQSLIVQAIEKANSPTAVMRRSLDRNPTNPTSSPSTQH